MFCCSYIASKFQFHFGSIGSSSGFFGFPNNPRFNSTLVRLEAKTQLQRILFLIVSIPLWFDWKSFVSSFNSLLICFNSTLVRLEVAVCGIPKFHWQFQFHFGSIGSEMKHYDLLKFYVSIPLWFDWKIAVYFHLFLILIGFNSTLVRLEGF